jgi:hypothetical protein
VRGCLESKCRHHPLVLVLVLAWWPATCYQPDDCNEFRCIHGCLHIKTIHRSTIQKAMLTSELARQRKKLEQLKEQIQALSRKWLGWSLEDFLPKDGNKYEEESVFDQVGSRGRSPRWECCQYPRQRTVPQMTCSSQASISLIWSLQYI